MPGSLSGTISDVCRALELLGGPFQSWCPLSLQPSALLFQLALRFTSCGKT
jgi:hypothetical protein